MKRHLVEISGNVYAAWANPGKGGNGWYQKGTPHCSKIKEAQENKMWITLKYADGEYMANGKLKKYPKYANYEFYVIKENKKYYIDLNGKTFNNLTETGKILLLKYLKAKITK